MKWSSWLIMLILLSGCSDGIEPTEPSDMNSRPNILLIIADDLGKDALAGFSEGTVKPVTPNLDKLRSEGLVFNNFWVNPTCSPTRASVITGKYGYRTEVKSAGDALDPTETILQKYIKDETNEAYATAIVGKWHLSGDDNTVNPESFGVDYYAGLIRGAAQDYYRWQKYERGETSLNQGYITEAFTDMAITWVNTQTKPWFLWLAYTAPHTPFHAPPSEMHSRGALEEYVDGADAMPYYLAAIEAMDYQIGQLLEGIPEEELDKTVIIFMGDNGTPNQVAQPPFSASMAKGSLYQGGINVPMFVSGHGVSRSGSDDNMICNTDIFSTIAELAGVEITEIHDSKSFAKLFEAEASHREFQYSEMDDGQDDRWTISNGVYKLIVDANKKDEMYDLGSDPYEQNDLLTETLSEAETAAKAILEDELSRIRN